MLLLMRLSFAYVLSLFFFYDSYSMLLLIQCCRLDWPIKLNIMIRDFKIMSRSQRQSP